ncbi:MAG: ATP--guanido phosphotransferase [Planctomycetota bacterium]|nr:ATP--guanido phosphotransferase [Planctomycetota bacterium]
MSDLSTLANQAAGWLKSGGEHADVVVSSRVRLARNVSGHPFRRELDSIAQEELVAELLATVDQATDWHDGLSLELGELSSVERKVLLERRLISREMVSAKHPGGLVVDSDEGRAVMINEEDHARIQALAPGLAVDACLDQAVALDRSLEHHLPWAISTEYGYLTSCPTNTGTGMRASVMMHLPALAETKEISAALRGIAKLHLTVRGLFGEGSQASGHYYQVSNQRTLGMTEHDIATTIGETVSNLVSYEQMARESMLNHRRSQLEDRVFRAWGLLTAARRLSGDELVDQLSWVRLGRAVGIVDCTWETLDRIFLQCQAAHLELQHPEARDAETRDEIRAGLVRTWLRQAA